MATARRRLRGPARAHVVADAPGTGKSAFGAARSRRIGAALLDQDVLTGPLTAVAADFLSSGVLTPPVVPHVAVDTTAPAATQRAAVLGRQPGPAGPDSQPGGLVRHH